MRKPELNPGGVPVIWWIATSTKKQKMSPRAQLTWCRQTSAEHGFYPIAVLRVPGHSRQYIFWHEAEADLAAYHCLPRVLGQERARFLLCVSRDRLGRDALAAQVEALCERHACKVWSGRTGRPVEGAVGQVYAAGFETTMSRASTRQFVEDRQRSFRRRVLDKGLPYTKPEFGYRIVRDSSGRSVGIECDPEHAEVRRWIDRQFVNGVSPGEIAKLLNARAVPPPRGQLWRPNTIRALLRSPFAAGVLHVQLNGEQLTVQGQQPILRPPEVQAEVQRLMRLRSHGSQRGTFGDNPWYGVAYCAACGARMVRQRRQTGKHYHLCGSYRQAQTEGRPADCTPHWTPDWMMVRALADFFTAPPELLINQPPDRSGELRGLQERLAEVRAQKRQAVRDKIKYRQVAGDFEAVLDELLEDETALLAQIAQVESEIASRPARAEVDALVTLLTGTDVKAWLNGRSPATIRKRLAGVVRLDCHQRELYSREPLPSVRLAI